MSYPVAIPSTADPVQKEMEDLAEALSKVLRVPVRVNPATFEVDDKNAADTLRSILKYVAVDHPNGKKAVKRKAAMSRAAYRFLDTGQVMTTRALNKILDYTDATDPSFLAMEHRILENHKGERFVIENFDGNLQLVREPK